jgi:hypothetical protein
MLTIAAFAALLWLRVSSAYGTNLVALDQMADTCNSLLRFAASFVR